MPSSTTEHCQTMFLILQEKPVATMLIYEFILWIWGLISGDNWVRKNISATLYFKLWTSPPVLTVPYVLTMATSPTETLPNNFTNHRFRYIQHPADSLRGLLLTSLNHTSRTCSCNHYETKAQIFFWSMFSRVYFLFLILIF